MFLRARRCEGGRPIEAKGSEKSSRKGKKRKKRWKRTRNALDEGGALEVVERDVMPVDEPLGLDRPVRPGDGRLQARRLEADGLDGAVLAAEADDCGSRLDRKCQSTTL